LIFCSNLPWIANVYQKDWLDFPALLQILDKVTKTVTESRQNLDEEQTALKCVEESTDNKLVILLIFCSNLPWIANVYQKDWLVGHKFSAVPL
jgi:hypothetical protein